MLRLAEGMVLFKAMAGPAIVDAARAVLAAVPPRRYATRSGRTMSVAMTNCGPLGWVSDRGGYRYAATDPETGRPWPPLPGPIRTLAIEAAARAGWPGFAPEACLVNLYDPDARMGLHQDRDERDLTQPIVSISLGRTGRFRFGGPQRGDPTRSCRLDHGDVLVFGGPARLAHHGIDRLEGPPHPAFGEARVNLTLRRVSPESIVST